MIRVNNIKMPLTATEESLRQRVCAMLKVKALQQFTIVKKSIDARDKGDVHYVYSVEVEPVGKAAGKWETAVPTVYTAPTLKRKLDFRPVVVGAGPCGLFAAFALARAGAAPIVLERGKPVEQRQKDVERFWKTGVLDTSSNVQFGEGGAGTFSDGKLNSNLHNPLCRQVLRTFHACGAPEEILYLAKPHVGTDLLPKVVKNMREEIKRLGGEFRFEHRLTDVVLHEDRLVAIRVESQGREEEIETRALFLATGHSARDTFSMLERRGFAMEQKPFAVGVRIEHLQQDINQSQYGKFAPLLGAADYKLVSHTKSGRALYTFCMCPGGEVVAAASEEGGVVTNGMSNFARDGRNANAALLVNVSASDFGSDAPLAGVAFQRELERKAFAMGKAYQAPSQTVGDFLAGQETKAFGMVEPTYTRGVVPSTMDALLPGGITETLRFGILDMDRKLRGFAAPEAVLTGPESRSSSPVRILRDASCQSSRKGVYPCGEGAGYAGGILSAAVDGIRCAQAFLESVE